MKSIGAAGAARRGVTLSVTGFCVEFQNHLASWVPMYAATSRQQLSEFLERMAIPEEGEGPRVIRISRILIDDGATQ